MWRMSTKRSYAGVPAAERKAGRHERLIEAVLDLAAGDGAAAVTVTGVCRAAGLNERYFYESFADRNEALVAAGDHVAETLMTRILAAVAAAEDDPPLRAAAAIRTAVDVLVDDPRKGALFLESASVPVLAQRRAELARAFVELLLSQALAALHLRRTQEIDSWGSFAATHLFGGVLETISAWLSGRLDCTREELVARNVEMFLAVGARVEHMFEQQ